MKDRERDKEEREKERDRERKYLFPNCVSIYEGEVTEAQYLPALG